MAFQRTLLSTAGATLVALVVLFPRATHAEEVADADRMGEYEENGMRFGQIVVKGELTAAANAPGGWALVRTFENTSDEPATSVVEERILRTESMPDARVDGTPVPVVVRTQTIKLAPHEKRRVGVFLAATLGEQITAGIKRQAALQAARAQAMESGHYEALRDEATYLTFDVAYWKPLAAGQTAEAHPVESLQRPARMPELAPSNNDLAGL